MSAPVFTPAELAAMVGYQLDPGHSDLDNEQPMSVTVHDGRWNAVYLRCTLGDIRAAKRDFYARLQGDLKRDLVLSLMLEALKAARTELKEHHINLMEARLNSTAAEVSAVAFRVDEAISQAEKLGGAK